MKPSNAKARRVSSIRAQIQSRLALVEGWDVNQFKIYSSDLLSLCESSSMLQLQPRVTPRTKVSGGVSARSSRSLTDVTNDTLLCTPD